MSVGCSFAKSCLKISTSMIGNEILMSFDPTSIKCTMGCSISDIVVYFLFILVSLLSNIAVFMFTLAG